jgi:hypothetical protein
MKLHTPRAPDGEIGLHRAGVVSKAVVRTADALDLRKAELAAILGVSPSTVSRLSDGRVQLEEGSKPYELAVLLIRLFRSLSGVLGGDAAMIRAWMRCENLALGGVPAELARSAQGLVSAVIYADAARARI